MRRLFLPTTLEPHAEALRYGAALAMGLDAEVVLYHVAPAGKVGAAREALAAWASRPPLKGLRTTVRVEEGSGHEERILEAARAAGADLLLLGATHRDLKHRLLGRTIMHLVHAAPLPVLVCTRPQGDPANPPPSLRKILVPTDLSAEADRVMPFPAELARRLRAAVVLLHVIEEPVPPVYRLAGVHSVLELHPDLPDKARVSLTHTALRYFGQVPYTCRVLTGRAVEEIITKRGSPP